MKLSWKKFIAIQFIFFVIILTPVFLVRWVSGYLSDHLIPSYSLTPPTHDNALATNLYQLREAWYSLNFLEIIPTSAGNIANFFIDDVMTKEILAYLILVGFWILILNIIFFSFIFIKKRILQ